MKSMKRQKDRTLKDELPRSIGGDQWRNNWRNNSRRMKRWSQSKNNTQLWILWVISKVRCCKEQYGIGIWNVRSMNQGKLEVVKQEVARVKSTF